MQNPFTRRKLLCNSLALGCSAAASPLLTPVTLAAAPTDNRLVVIVLRGAMDGLDVVQPYGDPMLGKLRSTLKFGQAAGAYDLDGFFALHPALGDLLPLWNAGELAFAHAVSTPYRDKRSHFDGQDFLENGGRSSDGSLTPARDGWLNRMLSLIPGTSAQTAFSVGRQRLLLLGGREPTSSWSPDADL
ncbi:MAG TPA: twin-arginine translocation pathway signal, partial [Devosia sp.]|nr:twin-arginine translocation pathway signal [Devosia sp.]